MKERQVNAETGEIIGSIMEWGTANEELLQEADICKLAIEHSAKEVSIIQHTTTDKHTIKLLKRLGFRYGGNEYVSFRDEENRYANSRDINSWRLRYGYADTIFF